jgi:REP element-mobilizing transposase RayT
MKVPEDRAVGFYHCVSRVVDRRRVFKETEKEHFVALMRECEAFCEVRVLTYCLMSNHFHILVQVPKPPEVLPTPEQILAKVRRLSGHRNLGLIEQRFAQFRKAGDTAGEAAYLERFYARMWDVSAFMKLLKQRFTQWYNGRMARKGTLWEDRFKSVVVEGGARRLGAGSQGLSLERIRGGDGGTPTGPGGIAHGGNGVAGREARDLKQIAGGVSDAPLQRRQRGTGGTGSGRATGARSAASGHGAAGIREERTVALGRLSTVSDTVLLRRSSRGE